MNLAHQQKYYKLVGKRDLGLVHVIARTWKKEGLIGFYGGLVPDLIKVLPTNTILMLCFEYLRSMLGVHNH